MATPPIHELTDRARDVFRIVVESYLDSGTPVGSRTISKISALNLSPASIRNVMQDLEEAGLLAAPHTSAGRMPTQSGLRLFVDGMMQASAPSAEERAAIESRAGQTGPIEEALANTTSALSGLSSCAGLVLVPKIEPVLRQFGFVPLSHDRALAVLVGEDGSVENRVVEIPGGIDPGSLQQAANYMSAMLTG
jgi:heat-inducible transcriptional repressor